MNRSNFPARDPASESSAEEQSASQFDPVCLADNLRKLCLRQGTISEVCRETGINRQQMARYVAGTASPRLDVFAKLCAHFNVSAQIMFEPLREAHFLRDPPSAKPPMFVPDIGDFFRADFTPSRRLENGFYRIWKPTFTKEGHIIRNLMYVWEEDGLQRFRYSIRPDGYGRTLSSALISGTIGVVEWHYVFMARMETQGYGTLSVHLMERSAMHQLLSGILLILSARNGRPPSACRAVFEKAPDLKMSDLKTMQKIMPNDQVPDYVADALKLHDESEATVLVNT